MRAEDEIKELLRAHGAVLERRRKHCVYKFPDGRCFTMASTLSDQRGVYNQLSDLRKFLGVKREIHKNPERKRKQGRTGTASWSSDEARKMTWKDKLAQIRVRPVFEPEPCCTGFWIQQVPMTPLWCILRNLIRL